MTLFFVDVESNGPAPGMSRMTEIGVVDYDTRESFYADFRLIPTEENWRTIMDELATWLKEHTKGRAIMVSDNPAFDFQWVSYYFHNYLGHNPFGHSARRISDYYAGLIGDFYKTQKWKSLRITPHDHNPVNDAMGNVEAFERLQKGERP